MIRRQAVVRTSQLSYGMGLEFTRIEPSEAEKLDCVIAELSGAVPFEPDKPDLAAPAAEPQRQEVSSDDLGEAVQRWFGTHDSLSRADFLKIVEELKTPVV